MISEYQKRLAQSWEGHMSDLQKLSEEIFPLLDAVRQEYCVRRLLVEVSDDGISILQMFSDGEAVVLF